MRYLLVITVLLLAACAPKRKARCEITQLAFDQSYGDQGIHKSQQEVCYIPQGKHGNKCWVTSAISNPSLKIVECLR